MTDDWSDPSGELVRPYTATRGRAHASRLLALEAMVYTTAHGRRRHPELLLDERSIVEMCLRPQSVIEIAAELRLPVGVVRVLVTDAESAGLVEITQLDTTDATQEVGLLGRVLTGLRRL
ncbi:DUF742 domain-containing protein [Parafrankia sp. FMc6]|uniref:DUF742 domain-containing protein n=1 Tax=Parafrankia soli TaxID=2599596 RepID=UPI0034D7A04A